MGEFLNTLHDKIKIIKDLTDKNNMLKLIRCSNHILNIVLVPGKNKVNCIQKAIRMMRGYKNPNVWGKIKILVIMSPRGRLGIQTYFFSYIYLKGYDLEVIILIPHICRKFDPRASEYKLEVCFKLLRGIFFKRLFLKKEIVTLMKS